MNADTGHDTNAIDATPRSGARRTWLLGAATLGTAAALGSVRAEEAPHAHHAMAAAGRGLIDAASHCVEEAEICDQHCLETLRQGDTTLAECAQRVRELAAMCTAARQLAVQSSPRLGALLEVCTASCNACEKECRKHEAKHAICKSCADACVMMVEAIKAHQG